MNRILKNKTITQTLIAGLMTFALSGCATFRTVKISYQVNEEQPVKSLATTVDEKPELSNKIDFDSNGKKTLVGLITGNESRKAKGSPQVEIYGQLAEETKDPNKENKEYDTNMGNTKKANYVWNGFVIWRDMKVYSRISFKTQKKDGKYNFIVQVMDCGDITMEVMQDYGNKTGVVPFKAFTSTDGTYKYSVYLTKDVNYIAFGADSNNQKLVEKYTPKSTTRELFNLKGQILQVVDSNGKVVAQVEGEKYNLYVPETDPQASTIMQTVGMVGTYIGIVNIMD